MSLDLNQEDLGNMTGLGAQIQRLREQTEQGFPFYMEHECGECFDKMSEHLGRCYDDSHEDEPGSIGYHWPPLCCPGCGCQSYEEAH